MKRAASIDIGSNTLRLLIGEETGDGNFRQLDSIRAITRLGEGMDTEKRLLPHRIDATLKALAEFRACCQSYGDMPLLAVATSAVREASNRDEFLRKAKEETGVEVKIIPWEEEARLTLSGVFQTLPNNDKEALVFDIGGGSTEFILCKNGKAVQSVGTRLGVVRLTERFITHHPVVESEYSALDEFLSHEIGDVKRQLNAFEPQLAIGTAGTVTTLAAIDGNIVPYDPEKIHGYKIPLERIEGIQNKLKSQTLEQRIQLPALEKGREDLIIAGVAITLNVLKTFSVPLLTVSENGLREGILLEALKMA